MIRRDIILQLQEWALKENRKPLVLRGARQVGKTTVVKEFGRQFKHYIYLNLEKTEDAEVFSVTDNIEEIMQYIRVYKHVEADDGSTLLFIDEIQNSPKAVALLRYFYEEKPDLFVIAAGSRLQTLIKERVSFPVGRVEYLSMRPCSFIEYLDAMDFTEYEEMILGKNVSSVFHNKIMEEFNRYALIGGMPEVVSDYAGYHDVARLSPIYDSLVKGYNEDAEKYAKNSTQTKVIRHILKYGWSYAGEAIKFAGFANSSYRSIEMHEAMVMLQKAFLLYLDYPATSTKMPVVPAFKRSPKLIWFDGGLVNFVSGIQLEFLQNKNLLDTWRGKAAEHIVAQELRVLLDKNFREEQYYWVRDKKGSKAEVDFVWQSGDGIIPIEVKSGNNAHLRSLHSFMSFSEQNIAVRIWNGEYSEDSVITKNGKKYKLINLPFYYTCVLDNILEAV